MAWHGCSGCLRFGSTNERSTTCPHPKVGWQLLAGLQMSWVCLGGWTHLAGSVSSSGLRARKERKTRYEKGGRERKAVLSLRTSYADRRDEEGAGRGHQWGGHGQEGMDSRMSRRRRRVDENANGRGIQRVKESEKESDKERE